MSAPVLDTLVPIAVLASGRGSNLAALLAAFPGAVRLVVSNNPDAAALDRAREAGIEAIAIDHRPHHGNRAAHEGEINAALEARGIGLVCLAGYMRRLTPLLVEAWAGRMLNIHPSLLPAFPGLDTHRRALAAGVAVHGCSVHLVTEGVDEGPILGQAAVPVRDGDTEETLAARVLAAEHVLYPAVLRRLFGDAAAPPEGMLVSLAGTAGQADAMAMRASNASAAATACSGPNGVPETSRR